MKMKIQSLAIVSAILTGVISAGAQPQEHRQRQQPGVNSRTPQTCPTCGTPRMNQPRQFQNKSRNFPQQGYRTGQQYRQQSRTSQYRQIPQQGRYGSSQQQARKPQQQCQKPEKQKQPQLSTEQKERRKALLKRFDRDGDGTLSEKEKASLKKSLQNKDKAPKEKTPKNSKKKKS